MIDLAELKKRFPVYASVIRSQPDPSCTCDNGVRTIKTGKEIPCLCICMSAPSEGEPEYRAELCRQVGKTARRIKHELSVIPREDSDDE